MSNSVNLYSFYKNASGYKNTFNGSIQAIYVDCIYIYVYRQYCYCRNTSTASIFTSLRKQIIIFVGILDANDKKPAKRKERGKQGKRSRTIFTPVQLEQLESTFSRQQYVAGEERRQLAAFLKLTETHVKVWFQNRRIRLRKQANHQTSIVEKAPSNELDVWHSAIEQMLYNQAKMKFFAKLCIVQRTFRKRSTLAHTKAKYP